MKKPSRRGPKHRSNDMVQIEHSNVELGVLPNLLPQTARDILLVLGAGGTAGNAAVAANVVKSAVSYWAKRFVSSGALIVDEAETIRPIGQRRGEQRFNAGYPKYYKLTPYGSKLLTGGEESCRRAVVLEDYPAKFLVLQGERSGCVDWKKLGEPRNWVKMGFRVGGVMVEKTSKHVIIHPGPLHGFNVDELQVESGRIVERVRYILEGQFGMRLGDEAVFCHGMMWRVYLSEAKEWIKQGGRVKVPGVGALDASPAPWLKRLDGVPHVEFEKKEHAALAQVWPPVAVDSGKRNASAAVMYPLYLEEIHQMTVCLSNEVKALKQEVADLKVTQFEFCCVQREITAVIRQLFNLGDDSAPVQSGNGENGGRGGKEYVS